MVVILKFILSTLWTIQAINGIPFHHHKHNSSHHELTKKFIGDPTTTPPPPTPPTRPTRPTPPTRPTRPTKCPEMQNQQGGSQGGCGCCSGGCPNCPGNFPPCPTDFPTISDDCQKHHHSDQKYKTENSKKRIVIPESPKVRGITINSMPKPTTVQRNMATTVLINGTSSDLKVAAAKKSDYMNEVLEDALFPQNKEHEHHPDKWADFYDNEAKWDTYMAPQLHHPQHVQLHDSNYHVRLGFDNLEEKTNHAAEEQSEHVEWYPGEIVSGENYLSKFIAPPVYESHSDSTSDCKKRNCVNKKLPFTPSRKGVATEAENTKDLFETLNAVMTPINNAHFHNGAQGTATTRRERPRSEDDRSNQGNKYDEFRNSGNDMDRRYHDDGDRRRHDDAEQQNFREDEKHGYADERPFSDYKKEDGEYKDDERKSPQFRNDERQSSPQFRTDDRETFRDNERDSSPIRNNDRQSFRNDEKYNDEKYKKNNRKYASSDERKGERNDYPSNDYMGDLLDKLTKSGWSEQRDDEGKEQGYYDKVNNRNRNGGREERFNPNLRVDRERQPSFTSLRPTYHRQEKDQNSENDYRENHNKDQERKHEQRKFNDNDSLFDQFRPDQESYFKGDPGKGRNKDFNDEENNEDDDSNRDEEHYNRDNDNGDGEQSENEKDREIHNRKGNSFHEEESHKNDEDSSPSDGKDREFEENREETGKTKTLQDKATNLLKALNLLKKKSVVKDTTSKHG